jgi:hypothetical protein
MDDEHNKLAADEPMDEPVEEPHEPHEPTDEYCSSCT